MNAIPKGLAAAALASLAACQSMPPANPDLAEAHAQVEQAEANPYAARSAAIELKRARQALQRADAAWADHRDVDETRHLAYLARRDGEIALAVGAQAQADERVQQAGAERDRARLEARTQQADAATAAARAAQQQAEASQQQAQASQQAAQASQQMAAEQAQRAAALQQDLQSLQARRTDRGLVVTIGDVLFATGKADLQPGALRKVQQLATVLNEHPERRVMVEGYTDSTGSEAFNRELSQRRAEAFRQALVDAGIAGARIEVRGHGEEYPVADNTTAAGRQQNRRVEVLFSDGNGQFAQR